MSLTDFLGRTAELIIIDFLGENIRYDYSASQIAEYTGLPQKIVDCTLPKLLKNKVITQTRYGYKLAPTKVARAIEQLALAHSFEIAEEETMEMEVKRKEEVIV